MQKNKNITEHYKLISDVLNRMDKLKQEYDLSPTPDRMTLNISLEYANLSINELKNLLSFDNGSFGHDVFGIQIKTIDIPNISALKLTLLIMVMITPEVITPKKYYQI